ncbi:MAG TPA: isoaspartyl peptidase/L-asparaginase [Candidatus Acidoferrales bacterium]|nr:isoaspartyl peptidase/L-asparaginase [Candidatus Acidoferrales bacterium]
MRDSDVNPPNFSLIVHGGAWDIPDAAIADCHSGISRALEAGRNVLVKNGSALDAIEAVIVVLEDDLTFDAGIGSHLNRDGRVQLDAILMDGASLKSGAVAAVERIRNPIRLARKILESSEHMMLAAAGAELFAKENGIPLCDPSELIVERERAAWQRCRTGQHEYAFHFAQQQGTVGAVARDSRGNLAAGTSTGGTCCKFPGRVGDSPLVGCGCYADSEAGAISCTGHGEAIMKIVMAKTAAEFLRAGLPAESAAKESVSLLAQRVQSTGGLILLDRHGHAAASFNTPRMAYGYIQRDGSFLVAP